MKTMLFHPTNDRQRAALAECAFRIQNRQHQLMESPGSYWWIPTILVFSTPAGVLLVVLF